jgi:hypothetical protein
MYTETGEKFIGMAQISGKIIYLLPLIIDANDSITDNAQLITFIGFHGIDSVFHVMKSLTVDEV